MTTPDIGQDLIITAVDELFPGATELYHLNITCPPESWEHQTAARMEYWQTSIAEVSVFVVGILHRPEDRPTAVKKFFDRSNPDKAPLVIQGYMACYRRLKEVGQVPTYDWQQQYMLALMAEMPYVTFLRPELLAELDGTEDWDKLLTPFMAHVRKLVGLHVGLAPAPAQSWQDLDTYLYGGIAEVKRSSQYRQMMDIYNEVITKLEWPQLTQFKPA